LITRGSNVKIYDPVALVHAGKQWVIEDDCSIGQFCFIAPRKLVMQRGAEICPQVTIGGGGIVQLGRYSTVCFGAKLLPATFSTKGEFMNDNKLESSKIIRGSITIGDRAYIGSNVVICISEENLDITIGEGSIVGANCYLDKSLPKNTIITPRGIKPR
jgi:acetyltransferase-like isoleucine patch superfamily enzyme